MHTSRTHSPAEWGATLLRVSLGTMFLAHSVVLKLLTYGLPGTATFFQGAGLPGWLAYVTFACEAAGGVLLVLGVQARWVALALSPFLLGALFAVHLPNGCVLCIAQALLGDGALALSPSRPLGFLLGHVAAQPIVR